MLPQNQMALPYRHGSLLSTQDLSWFLQQQVKIMPMLDPTQLK
jgi:hypothetical protein